MVQTVDFFQPLTDDPFLFGQIAAANALSDVYAMGGRPVTALNIMCFPDDKLSLDVMSEILRGGSEKAHEAGAVVTGGQSVRDAEIKYGMSVTGLVDPKHLVTNEAARPGDVLLLTKPIGTGALTVAYQSRKYDAGHWDECCEWMARLNRAASESMVAAGAKAATDITGYSLLGHASEVAAASGVTLEFMVESIPLMPGSLALSERGIVTRAASTNMAYLKNRMEIRTELSTGLLNLLVDAQTSGGLLIALPESALETFGKEMETRETPWHRVGRVTEKSDVLIRLDE